MSPPNSDAQKLIDLIRLNTRTIRQEGDFLVVRERGRVVAQYPLQTEVPRTVRSRSSLRNR